MNWDLSHLSVKYPWLQVNDTTLAEFRAPFEFSKKKIKRDEEESRQENSTKLSKKATCINAGRKVLLMNMRDHLTDAVVLKHSIKQSPTKKIIPVDRKQPSPSQSTSDIFHIKRAPPLRAPQLHHPISKKTHSPQIPIDTQTKRLQEELANAKNAEDSMMSRYLFQGFSRWKAHTTALRKEELRQATNQKIRIRAINLFNRVAGDCLTGSIQKALHRWRSITRRIIAEERHHAAIDIQKHVKRRRDTKRVAILRRERAATILMEEKLVIEFLAFEMYGRQHLWTIREHATKIRERRAEETRNREISTCKIQNAFRSYCARKRVKRLRYLKQQEDARVLAMEQARLMLLRKNSTLIQSIVRMFLIRLRYYNIRMQLRIEAESALTIQHAWRAKKGKKVLATRFAKRKVSIAEKEEREIYLARQRLIQELEKLRQASAIIMQRRIRGFLARKRVKKIKEDIQLDLAVRRVQAAWRKSKGRYALHLRFLAQKERLEWEREAACIRIQSQIRRFLATKRAEVLQRHRKEALDAILAEKARQIMTEASATTISRVYRGHNTRNQIRSMRSAATKIQCCFRSWRARKLRNAMRQIREMQRKKEHEASISMQRLARGYLGRLKARRRQTEITEVWKRKHRAAMLLQKRCRGIYARRAVSLLKQGHLLVHIESEQTLSTCKSSLQKMLESLDLSSVSRTQIKALEAALKAANDGIREHEEAVIKMQSLCRGRRGRKIANTKLQEKETWNRYRFRCARNIQRIVRGFLGRRKAKRTREARTKADLQEAYRRERIALEDKKKWLEQLEMERFKNDAETRKQLEIKLKIAQQQEEIARLDAQTNTFKLQALEAQTKLKEKQAAAWREMNDGYGNIYYYNDLTAETSWEMPESLKPPKVVIDRKEDWEELYNPNTGEIYQHNRVTGAVKMNPVESIESPKKEEPVVVEETKPDVVDNPIAPSQVVELSPVTQPIAVEIKCWRCKKQRAVKECVTCVPDNRMYCSSCYAKEHRGVAKKGHDFKRINSDGSHTCSMCYKCENKASYYCKNCDPGFKYMCDGCFSSTHATADFLAHEFQHFREGAALCGQCSQPEPKIALRNCSECQDNFCNDCFNEAHAKGKKKAHLGVEINVLKAALVDKTDAYCVECEVALCTKLCNLCGDGFCDTCYTAVHSKGRKVDHSSIPWKEMTLAGDWIEIYEGKTHMYYNIITKESTAEKPSVLMLGVERHRELVAEKTREKKKIEGERDAELIALREKLKAMEEEKEIARRQQQEAMILNENPQVLQAKPKRKWWKSKAQIERERKERENQVVMSLLLTKQRQEKLHREAMEVGSSSYTNAIVEDIVGEKLD